MAEKNTPKTAAFFQDMETLLKKQITEQPNNTDLRVRLAELYFETGDRTHFLEQSRLLLKALSGKEGWTRIAEMGRALLPDEAMFKSETGLSIDYSDPTKPSPAASRYARFGEGARYEKLFNELAQEYENVRSTHRFLSQFDSELIRVESRPSPLFHADRLTKKFGGAQVYIKREDLMPATRNMTVAVVGQAMLARHLGKTTLVTGSNSGQKGLLMASVAARMGLKAVIYMKSEDVQRNQNAVFRMWMMGAFVEEPAASTYKNGDIRQAALEHWAGSPKDCFLVMGLDSAPHPYPMMVREFNSVIGRETQRQIFAQIKKAPDLLVARAGNNADALGFFPPFLAVNDVQMACVEGHQYLDPPQKLKDPSTTNIFDPTELGLTDQQRKVINAIQEGLEYPSVTREHAWLRASGRVEYVRGTLTAAKRAITDLGTLEGIICPVETAYAVGWACDSASRMKPEQSVIVMLSESSQKDMTEIGKAMGLKI